jgi:hypothetical protein
MLVSGVLAASLAYPLVHFLSWLVPQHLPAKRVEVVRMAKKTA